MLILHTLRYLPAQVVSPLAQLAAMVLWTHWLVPSEMGIFTIVSVTQEIAYLGCLGWFAVYALRYLPPDSDAAARLRYLGTENGVVLASVVLGMGVALATAWSMHGARDFALDTCAIGAFFVTKALNAHYAERARAQSAFLAYTILQVAGPVGGLVLGWVALTHATPSAVVLLLAYAAAQAIGTALAVPGLGITWRLPRPDTALLRAAVVFGGPVLALSLLSWAAENYIRYLVEWRAGVAALGLMNVGWSLGRRCASVTSMMVTTAGFPIASRLLNEGRNAEALAQLRVNTTLMVAVLLPVTAALQILGPAVITLTVAPDYRETANQLLGMSMFAGALRNLHVHATDQLMILQRRFRMAAQVSVVEIIACTVASLLGLAAFGLPGAVVGQGLGSALALALSMYWARTALGFRWPWLDTARLCLATGLMAGILLALHLRPGLPSLAMGTVVGGLVYAAAGAVLFLPALRAVRASAAK